MAMPLFVWSSECARSSGKRERDKAKDLWMGDPGLQLLAGAVPSFPRQVWAHV